MVPGCFDWDLSKQAHITYSLTGKLVVMATLANCPARDKLAFHKRRWLYVVLFHKVLINNKPEKSTVRVKLDLQKSFARLKRGKMCVTQS